MANDLTHGKGVVTSSTKTKKIENLNNKFACTVFLFIGELPKKPLTTADTPMAIFIMDENVKPFLCYMVDALRVKIGKIPSSLTLPANGIPASEFRTKYYHDNPGTDEDTEIMVYFFVKDDGNKRPPKWTEY
ncbi:MAG TPA: hypothetical protein VFJ43_18410 [Bacteroidia bacterium]|nr:hypothetical protein [Bacteroidia bacterium]